MIPLSREALTNLGKFALDEDKKRSHVKEIAYIDNSITTSRIINAKIEENLYMHIFDSQIKKDHTFEVNTNQKTLKIRVVLDGEFTKVNNLTKEELNYTQNHIFIEYNNFERSTIINKKNQRIKYLCITLMEDYLNENDFLYDVLKENYNQNFIIKFFEANLKSKYEEIFTREYKSMIDKLYFKNKTMELLLFTLSKFEKKEKHISYLNLEDIKRIHEAKKILEESYDKKITIPILSKKVAINEFKLKKGFKEIFEITIHEHLKNIRLEKSVELLLTKEYTVKEVGSMVGYTNQASFSYAFSKKFNFLPKELLK